MTARRFPRLWIPASRPRPLHLTILRLVAALVLATALGIEGLTYYYNSQAVRRLAGELVEAVTDQAVHKTRAYFEPAERALVLNREVMRVEAGYAMGADAASATRAWRSRARLCLNALRSTAQFDMVYYGDRHGTFAGARRVGNSFTIDRRWGGGGRSGHELYRVVDPAERWEVMRALEAGRATLAVVCRERSLPVAAVRRWQAAPRREAGEEWLPLPARADGYDPRSRPWYRAAAAARALVWTRPYLFFDQRVPGITAALPIIDPEGRVSGVLGVDYQLAELDRFVGGALVGRPNQVFILTAAGDVLAHPRRGASGLPAGDRARDLTLPPAAHSNDPVLRSAATHLAPPPGRRTPPAVELEFVAAGRRYLGAAEPFSVGTALAGQVVVLLEASDVFAPVRRSVTLSLCVGGGVLLLALLLGWLLSVQLSRPLGAFAAEMKRVGNYTFSDTPVPASPIAEVAQMGAELEGMKISLRSFERYVPRDLVRLLPRTGAPAVLGGETCRVTLFFADVVDFTTISEGLPPDALVGALGAYLAEIERIIRGQGGVVDKFVGDAVMALWDPPICRVDEPERRACAAALESMQRLQALQAQSRAERRPVFQARVGIHTGEALVGNIGSPDRLAYTAMGDAVNLASRLESLNRFYGTRILISEATWSVVRDRFEAREIDAVAVVGRRRRVVLYELLAARGGLDPAAAAAREHYHAGLRLYRSRDWSGAADCLRRALALQPEDGPSHRLLARCEEYATTPPPPEWDGVFIAPTK
jgi:adenylate cyclase